MPMNLNVGDIVVMKKGHPCGGSEWKILRVGMDIKLLCLSCGREIMLPRAKAEKGIKIILGREELTRCD